VSHRPANEGKNLQKPSPAVDPFYTATEPRSRGALWSIFAPALRLTEGAMIRSHCLTCKLQFKNEIQFVNKLFEGYTVAA
jgi:hypothetical protein